MGENCVIKKENKNERRMKFLKELDLKSLLIFALIIIILLMRMCSGGQGPINKKNVVKIDGKKYVVVKRDVDTIVEQVEKVVYKDGKTIYVDNPVYVNVPSNVDTNYILKRYYSKLHYTDTLKINDTIGYIVINDTIYKNKILNRKWDSHINKFTVKETIYVEPLPKIQVFFGGNVGFDNVNIVNYAGPTLVLKDKKDKLYSLGIGYSGNKTIGVQVGIYWKIKLKK